MHATVLFAHGSRDPAWRLPIDRVAECMQTMDTQHLVRCAFLELTKPDLATVTKELVTQKIKRITIVPMFLGIGRHAREDLPLLVSELKCAYPEIVFELRPSIGEDPRVIELLAHLSMPT
ncbi:MAG: cobalamin biosynthesis protein CbiX [Comamonadaceae bacterium CG2_30_57_122]|nr:MAG: cobalamin biosynthesis protein CbiX [Comamonadaceae bacterium CG2_30_57_122]